MTSARPRHLHAELGFVVPPDASARMHDPALGASALLDMGIYPLTLAHLMLGEAEELVATAHLSEDGIDLDVAISGRYPGGALASMSASMTSWSSRRAEIATDTGRLSLEDFHHPDFATWVPFAAAQRRRRPAARRSGSPARCRSSATASATRSPRSAAASRPGCGRARSSRTPRR